MTATESHRREDVLSVMQAVAVAAVATSAGDKLRVRMMHYATDDNFNIYVATMKGDPKTIQMTHHPSISLLVSQPGSDISQSKEVEITGKAVFVTDQAEREQALKMTALRSPVVKYLTDTGNSQLLDCIKVVLYINEFPDYTADKRVGKKTLVVRLGRGKAVNLFVVIMAGVYLSISAGVTAGILPVTALLGLMTLPLAFRAIQYARKHYAASFDLIPANALTVTSHLATGLLLTLAFVWQVLGSEGLAYVILLAAIFAVFVILMYRHIERQKSIFLGLKQVVR